MVMSSRSAALLELFSAAAGTGIVPACFGAFAPDRRRGNRLALGEIPGSVCFFKKRPFAVFLAGPVLPELHDELDLSLYIGRPARDGVQDLDSQPFRALRPGPGARLV